MSKLMDRRQLLAKLGLAVGVAYIAPAMLSLSEARASGGSAGSSSGPSRSSVSALSRASRSSFSRPSSSSSATGRRDARCRVSFSDGRARRTGNCPPVRAGNPFARLLRSSS